MYILWYNVSNIAHIKRGYQENSFLLLHENIYCWYSLEAPRLGLWVLITSEALLIDNISSRKHSNIILTPLNPLLYSKTGVYRGINNFVLFLLKNIDCGHSLELPPRGGSNEYPQSMSRNMKNIGVLIWKLSFFFFVVKFSVYLK